MSAETPESRRPRCDRYSRASVVRQLGELGLDRRRDDDGLGAEVRLRELADGLHVRRLRLGRRELVLRRRCRRRASASRSGGRSAARSPSRPRRAARVNARRPASRCASELLGDGERRARLLVAAAGVLLELVPLARRRSRGRRGRARSGSSRCRRPGSSVPGDVDDVLVLEAAHDLDDRVDLADVLEELVAEALALRRALARGRRCPRTRSSRERSRSDFEIFASGSSRASGTVTTPTFGSIVQNG